MADNILAKGVRWFDKNQNAPSFVLGTVILTLDDVQDFFKEQSQYVSEYQGKKQLKLQMLKSKEGKTYFNLDTYKKPESAPTGGGDDNGLPF